MVLGLVTGSMFHPVNQLRPSARFDAQTGPASSSSAILAADALMDVLAVTRRRPAHTSLEARLRAAVVRYASVGAGFR